MNRKDFTMVNLIRNAGIVRPGLAGAMAAAVLWTLVITGASPCAADNKRLEERVAALEEKSKAAGKPGLSDIISINGVLAGTLQNEDPGGPAAQGVDAYSRGAVAFQPEISITPTDQDEIVFGFGFPAGNGINGETRMWVAPWAANLEDDVKGINGRNRDYLLTAYYKHTFKLGANHELGVTGGIIDSTAFLDQNAYANDEFTQFLNPALVNGPNGFAPSFDLGGALEWAAGGFYLNGVVMNIGQSDAGYNYNFYGGELGYTVETALGAGTYRIVYEGGQDAFGDPTGTTLEDRSILFLSCDQQFGELLGAWIRFGWGTDDAEVDAANLYSGGVDVRGGLWGRGKDNVGLGYALFDGGNSTTGLDSVTVAEAYYRFVFNDLLALTADVQYQDNRFNTANTARDIDALTLGLRGVVEF